MNTITILGIIQIIIAVLLTVVILVQSKGAGLGGVFGGEGNVYKSKQGLEKFLMIATIVLAVLFIGLAIVGMLII